MKIEWRQVTTGECETMDQVPKGATIEAVNDMACMGRCEGCGRPILDGDKYQSDDEGALVCERCFEA